MATKIAAHQIKGVYKILNLEEPRENWKIKIYLRSGRNMIFPTGKAYLNWRQFTEEAQDLILKSIEDCICYTEENGCNYACPCHNPFMSGVCSNCVIGKKRIVDDIEKALTSYFKRNMNKQTAEMWEKNRNEDLLGVLSEAPNSTVGEKLIKAKELQDLIDSLTTQKEDYLASVRRMLEERDNLNSDIRVYKAKVDSLDETLTSLKELLNRDGK